MYLRQLFLILLPLFLGELISTGLGLPIPGNVLGLLLLFGSLFLGILKLSQVEQTADFIISHLALFFVAPTVGIMLYFDIISQSFLRILGPLLLSILAGFLVAGQVTQLAIRFQEKRNKGRAVK